MPLDAQDRIAVEKLEELFRGASYHAKRKTSLELVSSAKVMALSILEMCPPSELRSQIFAQLRTVAMLVAAAALEEEKSPPPQAAAD